MIRYSSIQKSIRNKSENSLGVSLLVFLFLLLSIDILRAESVELFIHDLTGGDKRAWIKVPTRSDLAGGRCYEGESWIFDAEGSLAKKVCLNGAWTTTFSSWSAKSALSTGEIIVDLDGVLHKAATYVDIENKIPGQAPPLVAIFEEVRRSQIEALTPIELFFDED